MAKSSMSGAFRALLAQGDVIIKPGAHNALSARIIEKAGFESLGVSGYAVSATLLGKPDCGLVTLDEMVMMSRYIAGAVNIPAIADADTGYGNAINVMRGATAISEYCGLPEQEAFDIEYWLLEEAKLQRMPKPKSLSATCGTRHWDSAASAPRGPRLPCRATTPRTPTPTYWLSQ